MCRPPIGGHDAATVAIGAGIAAQRHSGHLSWAIPPTLRALLAAYGAVVSVVRLVQLLASR